MSSHSYAEVDPPEPAAPPIVHTQVRGRTAISLQHLLGERGRTALQETAQQLVANPVAGMPVWQKAAGFEQDEHVYQTHLPAAKLPADLQHQGVQGLDVALHVNPQSAMVTHECQFTAAAAVPQQAVQASIKATVNRTVNQVFAMCVLTQLQQELKQFVAQRQENRVYNLQYNDQTQAIEAHAFAGGARR